MNGPPTTGWPPINYQGVQAPGSRYCTMAVTQLQVISDPYFGTADDVTARLSAGFAMRLSSYWLAIHDSLHPFSKSLLRLTNRTRINHQEKARHHRAPSQSKMRFSFRCITKEQVPNINANLIRCNVCSTYMLDGGHKVFPRVPL
jgi:hypothetical protein